MTILLDSLLASYMLYQYKNQ